MIKGKIKTIADFWYYYKYYLLVGIVAVVALGAVVKSCSEKKDYDVGVLFMTHGAAGSYYQTEGLSGFFDGYASDVNGDGISNSQVVSINYGSTLKEANAANASRSANLAAGEHLVYLMDEQNYNELKAGGFLADISGAGESEYLDSDCFDAAASGMLSAIEGFGEGTQTYFLCLRVCDAKRAESDEKYAARYDAAKSVVYKIVDEYK